MNTIKLDNEVLELKEYVINMRRLFHQHPEIGFNEIFTRDTIIKQLKEMSFDKIEIVAKTGIKATIITPEAIKTIAFRADIDALPVTELNDKPYISQNPGFMHACGHDGHIAALLGFARLLSRYRNDLTANIILIFQPAEESEGGAFSMIKNGVLDNPKVDEIYAMHIFPELEQGKIGIRPGPIMAQTSEFDIDITGRSAHGAMPHKGIDTIVIASQLIQMLQSIITRSIDPTEQALITIGKIYGGKRRNIIAEHTTLEGMLRTFSDEVYETIKTAIIKILNGLQLTYGITCEYKELVNYPVVYNDPILTERLINIVGKENIVNIKPQMIAEDFSFFQKVVPGVYFLLGSKNEKFGFTAPLHSERFDFDESILLTAVQIYKKLADL